MMSFPPKDYNERISLEFSFADHLIVEDIVPDSIIVTIDTASGYDDSPGKVLVGPPQLIGEVVSQVVEGGNPYCIYRVTCQATTNDGRILVISAYLPISGYISPYSQTYTPVV